MSTICVIFTVLITVFVLMTAQYNNVTLDISIMYTSLSFKISLIVYSLMVFALGILAGMLFMLSSYFSAAGRYSRLKKQYDKTSDGADSAQETIEVLENKIKTLETALAKALNKD